MVVNDEQIIKMLFDRDERAMTVIENKYGTLCRKIAYSIIGDYDEVADCINDSFFQLWNAVPPTRPESLKAYLCGIVRNVATGISKKRRLYIDRQTNLSELEEIFPDSGSTEGQYDGKMLARYINEFLSRQKDAKQKIFIMRYYYNFSISDISLTVKMKEATVKTHLFRMRKELRLFLTKKGYNI